MQEACNKCRELIRQDATFVAAYQGLAEVLFLRGQRPAAEETLRQILRIDPSNLLAHYTLPIYMLKQERSLSAIAKLQAVLGRNPHFAPGHNLLGIAYEQTGNTAAQVGEFQQPVWLDPAFLEAKTILKQVLQQANSQSGKPTRPWPQ